MSLRKESTVRYAETRGGPQETAESLMRTSLTSNTGPWWWFVVIATEEQATQTQHFTASWPRTATTPVRSHRWERSREQNTRRLSLGHVIILKHIFMCVYSIILTATRFESSHKPSSGSIVIQCSSTQYVVYWMTDSRLSPRLNWIFPSSELLLTVRRFGTTFPDYLSVPTSKVRMSKNMLPFFLELFTLEDGTDR
jgi:hypothetical protein